MTRRPAIENRPDGPGLSPNLWDMHRRHVAAANHMQAEGCYVSYCSVHSGYDRTLHPYIHGRRPADIVAAVREVLSL
ncbi:hypothetical protein [Haloarcula sp. CBA1122]|uniref:hypothetical protein n=1 Tax=Haloarcula sp. CBA1122 TaxID=2668069 RepID=UPI00130D45D0|nr:hypothetical protein [Haloarcula sp. CBA1122]MUV51336.1 hypothetical protein [Haloarcula sp. CBA1122]